MAENKNKLIAFKIIAKFALLLWTANAIWLAMYRIEANVNIVLVIWNLLIPALSLLFILFADE